MAGVLVAIATAGEARRSATSWCFSVRPTAALLRPRAAIAAFSSETLISDGDLVAGDERAGVATEAAAAAGGGVGGGDAEAAEEDDEAAFGVEADEAPVLFPPLVFFVMGNAYVLKTLTRESSIEQQLHLERLWRRREEPRGRGETSESRTQRKGGTFGCAKQRQVVTPANSKLP